MPATPAERPDSQALFETLYSELRRIAAARMNRERPGLTVQPTALVHEAYLRLIRESETEWQTPAQFVSAAATAMRRILVERNRRGGRLRHGGEWRRVPLERALEAGTVRPDETGPLSDAVDQLMQVDPRLAQVVQLRFFAGQSVEQTAALLGVSDRTVRRDWEAARLWLHRRLRSRVSQHAS